MYDELIIKIRQVQHWFKPNESECFDPYEILEKAADAIEELQKQLCEEKVANVNLTGWLAEEHAKQCPHYIWNVHDRGDDSMCKKWLCEINDLQRFLRWIPVTERLPEDRKMVLATVDGVVRVAFYGNYMWEEVETYSIFYPTHWMPLPEPPKDGEA